MKKSIKIKMKVIGIRQWQKYYDKCKVFGMSKRELHLIRRSHNNCIMEIESRAFIAFCAMCPLRDTEKCESKELKGSPGKCCILNQFWKKMHENYPEVEGNVYDTLVKHEIEIDLLD